MTNLPTLRSQAHLQGAQALTQSQPCKRASLHPRTGNTLLFLLLVLLTVHSNAQPAVPRPVFQNFQPINIPTQQAQTQQQFINQYLNNQTNVDPAIKQQNMLVMQQMGIQVPGLPSPPNKQQQQIDQLHQLLNEEKKDEYALIVQRFQNYLNIFLQLNPDSFSITKAVYLSESPYYGNAPSFEIFEGAIKQRANIVKQILKKEGFSINNGSAVNYAIQKLFSQNNIYHDAKTNKDYLVKKISYDFDDFYGENDFTKMLVSKVLQTNSGQCHSMPLLYLCIAEQLHAKAYLSLAPNHSFIQFFDSKNTLHNFETTNGHTVSASWLLQSDAISAMAYKNKTYLDTLSQRKLYAECLADFQNSYIARNGYDNFTQQLTQKILSIDRTNINALMTNANAAFYQFSNLLNQYGNPPKEQLSQYPQLEQAYNNMVAAQQKINETGYQDMPKEQYIEWLKSVDREKAKNNKTSTKK